MQSSLLMAAVCDTIQTDRLREAEHERLIRRFANLTTPSLIDRGRRIIGTAMVRAGERVAGSTRVTNAADLTERSLWARS